MNATKQCDVFVAGTGIAGMSSALFAANRGLSVVQAGSTGEIIFSSGLMDVMAVHPIAEKKLWNDPWAAMQAVSEDIAGHPYARLSREDVESAYTELFDFLGEYGLRYRTGGESNCQVITPVGTVKYSWAVPETMWAGVEAFERRDPVLLVDFEGLREYSAGQICNTLKDRWTGLRHVRVECPGLEDMKPILTGIMGQAFELKANRDALCERIRPHLGDAKAVGLPAVLGIYSTGNILAEMEEMLGVPVFELPTLPASVPGMRLKSVFEGRIAEKGVDLQLQHKVFSVEPAEGGYLVTHGIQKPEETVFAKAVILATGRFLGGGLSASYEAVSESVMGLPVFQPASRHDWHKKDLFDAEGHAINSAGVETDSLFRPVSADGSVLHEGIFAVGSILAHQDWMRMKCGSGIAVGSARKAVDTIVSMCK